MAPVRNYSNWNKRTYDQKEQIEPYKKFFFICEGANTEVFYFKRLIDLRKQLGSHALIDLCLLEKTEKDKDISHPKRLLEFAQEQKKNDEISFDEERDQMILVIDADIYKRKPQEYEQLLAKAEAYHDTLAVTNPAFELFLLLHYENFYQTDILPHADEILANRKENNRRFISQLFSKKSGMNSKTNPKIGTLAKNVDIAIAQEKHLNQNPHKCNGTLTCNIGKLIEEIKNTKVPHGN